MTLTMKDLVKAIPLVALALSAAFVAVLAVVIWLPPRPPA